METIIKKYNQAGDNEVIGQIINGQTALFEILVRRYNPLLYKIGRSYGFDHHITEDLMQETYVNAYFHLASFEQKSSFKTWIFRLMLNNCYHASQKRQKRSAITETLVLQEDDADNIFQNKVMHMSENADKTVLNLELSDVLESALSHLPEKYRIIFTLRELNGLSTAEAATVLGISESNAKVRLNRARSLMQKEVLKMYSPEDIYAFDLIYCDRIVESTMAEIKKLKEAAIEENN